MQEQTSARRLVHDASHLLNWLGGELHHGWWSEICEAASHDDYSTTKALILCYLGTVYPDWEETVAKKIKSVPQEMLPTMENVPAKTTGETTKIDRALDELTPIAEYMASTKYVYVTESHQLQEAISDMLQCQIIGFDTETTGLDWNTEKIRLIQIAVSRDLVYLIDCFRVDTRPLQIVFDKVPFVVGHNLNFDYHMIEAEGFTMPEGKRTFDTQLATQILGAGSVYGYMDHSSLANTVARYCDVYMDKAMQRSDWTQALTDEQLQYAAYDAAILLPLSTKLSGGLKARNMIQISRLENRCLPALVWMEQTGIQMDRKAWFDLQDQANIDKLRTMNHMNELADVNIAAWGHGGMINWGSPAQVATVLQGRGHVIDSTNERALLELAVSGEEIAQEIIKYRKLDKLITTYGQDYLNYIHPKTGRVHPHFLQLGAGASGRMSCSRPNIQNVPRNRLYRACFEAPKGYKFVKADYSQIELRVAAIIANDYVLQEAYRQGADVHELTASLVLGAQIGAVTPEQRQAAKAVNFGFIYGMGAEKFRAQAYKDYGVSLTLEEAQKFRKLFFDNYTGIRTWHRTRPQDSVTTYTLMGRQRMVVTRYSEKLNTPVQGTAADGVKLALARLYEDREHSQGGELCITVHDEICAICPDGQEHAVENWLVSTMESAMSEALMGHDMPILVEAKIGNNWSGS